MKTEKKYTIKTTKDNENGSDLIVLNYEVKKDFSLFQYRKCSIYNLNSLLKNQIWGTTPDKFNDPYDSAFRFDYERIIEYALKSLTQEEIILLKIENKEQNMKKSLKEYFLKQYQETVNLMKRSVTITCLSEENNSEIMWSHYADNGTGFAVEYNFIDIAEMTQEAVKTIKNFFIDENTGLDLKSSSMDNWDEIYRLAPVIYDNSKFDASIAMINLIDFLKEYLLNNNKSDSRSMDFQSIYNKIYDYELHNHINTNIYYKKKKVWRYEKEWRIIVPNTVYSQSYLDLSHQIVGCIKPKSIYLGEFISYTDEYTIKKFAIENDISLYKMVTSDFRNTKILKSVSCK